MQLGKLFLKLWLFLLATSYTSWTIQKSVFEWHAKEMRTEQRTPFVTTAAESVELLLKDVPPEQWPSRYASLSKQLTFPTEVITLGTLEQRKDIDISPYRDSLLAGKTVVTNPVPGQARPVLRRLGHTDNVLVIKQPADNNPPLYFGLFQASTFTWIVESTLYGTAVLLWLSLFWHDLKKIGKAADAVGEGKFSAVADLRRGSALRPLADSFNHMTARISALVNSQKDLTNAVSHELRTPLARLRFALTLSEETDNPAERQQLLHKMQRDVDELDELTNEMLTYSRLDRETPDFKLSPVPIDSWLPQIIEDETDAARAAGIELPVTVKTVIREAPSEPKFMARAVSNLVRNALRFAKSKVEVEVAQNGRQYFIHVDDDGPGIPEGHREKLFVPFARLDESRARSSGGMGLGLAIVRRIAERHGGQALIGTSPLGGARITIAWPLA